MGEKVAIITDTIGCIPEEILKKYNIHEVPLGITFGDKVYKDRVDLKADEFYKMLKEAERLPTTSGPPPESFVDAYNEISRVANRILCITLSKKLSSTYNSAKLAGDMIKEKLSNITVEILDSQTAAAAEGFVVIAAAKAASMGKSFNEVMEAAKNTLNRVHLLAIVDTFHYLSKGGRVPKAVDWAGSLLKIKPILTIRAGEACLATNSRTTLNAMNRMLELMKERVIDGSPLHVAVMHAAEPERALYLKKQISDMFSCNELWVTDFTPVMGAHTGPGLVGVAFYNGD